MDQGNHYSFTVERSSSVPVFKKGPNYYIVLGFLFSGVAFLYLFVFLILSNTVGFGIQMSVATIAAFSALSYWLRRREHNHQLKLALSAKRNFDVSYQTDGVRFVEGRTTTFFGWEDVESVRVEGPLILTRFRRVGVFALAVSVFKNEETLEQFINFVRLRIAGTQLGNA